MKKVSRDSDPHKGSRRGGYHGTPKGDKGYTRKEKHPGQSGDQSNSESLTPEDETYREMMFPIADVLSWDIPAEGRPCGEGEDPKKGKCNPNHQPADNFRPERNLWNPDYSDQEGVAPERHPDDVSYPERWPSGPPDYSDEDPYGPIPLPGEKPGRYDIGPDEYRNDPDEWDRMNKKAYDDEQRHQKAWEKEQRMSKIAGELDWSTHKSETFDDTGEKGLHPAWGLKSIIDRGVKPHEKPGADKRIGEAENSTTKRTIPSKSFKSYSMVHAFEWSSPFSKLEPRGSNPLGGPIGGDPQPEVVEEGANV
jgi:hypothetical protein